MANFHCDTSPRFSGSKVPQARRGAPPAPCKHRDHGSSEAEFAVSIVAVQDGVREELVFRLQNHQLDHQAFAAACAQRHAGLAGADAWLLKPIDLDELVHVLASLRSHEVVAPADASPRSSVQMHTWQLDARRGFLVAPNGGRKIVSPTERLILNVLAEDGCVRSHRELAVALGLHPENFDKHRIEVIVSRLRRSTYRETGIHLPLTSVRRLGYQLLDVQVV